MATPRQTQTKPADKPKLEVKEMPDVKLPAAFNTAQQQQAYKTMHGMLAKLKPEIERVMPKGQMVEKFMRVLLTEVQRTPTLLECTPRSVLRSVLQAAQLGLQIDSVLGTAYLVPYRNKKAGGQREAQLIVGYRGLITLAHRSDEVSSVSAHVVYEHDEFQFEYGTEEKLRHVPSLEADRGQRIATYAIAQFKDEHALPQIEVLGAAQVEWLRSKSQAKDDGPWVTDTDAMWRKSAVRQLAKFLPLSPEDQRAVQADDQNERKMMAAEGVDVGEFMDLSEGAIDLDAVVADAATQQKTDAIKQEYAKDKEATEKEKELPIIDANDKPTGELLLCCPDAPAGIHVAGCPNAPAAATE